MQLIGWAFTALALYLAARRSAALLVQDHARRNGLGIPASAVLVGLNRLGIRGCSCRWTSRVHQVSEAVENVCAARIMSAWGR